MLVLFLLGLALLILLMCVAGTWCSGKDCSKSSSVPSSTPVDGSCGSANGVSVSAPPSGSGLCASGVPTNLSGPGTSGIYSWSCLGTGGGSGVSCASEPSTPPVVVGIPLTSFSPEVVPVGGPYSVTATSGGPTLSMNTSGNLLFDTQMIGTAKNLLKGWNISGNPSTGFTITNLLGDGWSVNSVGVSVGATPTRMSFGSLSSGSGVFPLVPLGNGMVAAIGISGSGATASLAVISSTSGLSSITPLLFTPFAAAKGAAFGCGVDSPPSSIVPLSGGSACSAVGPPDPSWSLPSMSSNPYLQIWAGTVSGFFSVSPNTVSSNLRNMSAWPDLPQSVYLAGFQNFNSNGTVREGWTPTTLSSATSSTPFGGGLTQTAFRSETSAGTYTLGIFVSDIESVLAGHGLSPTSPSSTAVSGGLLVWYTGNAAQMAAAGMVIAPLLVASPANTTGVSLPLSGGSARPSMFMTATTPSVAIQAYNYVASAGYTFLGIQPNSPVPYPPGFISGTGGAPYWYFVGFTGSPSLQTSPLDGPATV